MSMLFITGKIRIGR